MFPRSVFITFYACYLHVTASLVYTSKRPETAAGPAHLRYDVCSPSRLRAVTQMTLIIIQFAPPQQLHKRLRREVR